MVARSGPARTAAVMLFRTARAVCLTTAAAWAVTMLRSL